MNIPIAKTVFEDAEFEEILKPLKSGWVVQGPFVKEFEDKWSEFTGSKYSIAVSNCTTALHLSLVAYGISAGDEVIVPAFTWVSTANVVEYQGAKPIFCDIDLRTFNLDLSKVEQLITAKTKAIIPVHLFGLPVEMDLLNNIAKKYGLIVIEDAACGFAARYRDVHVGLQGHTGCFSFHPRKAVTTGEGGMITTPDENIAIKLRSLRDHGASVTDLQRHIGPRPYLLPEFPHLGFNYRMTDLQASIGSTQMSRAYAIHQARSEVADRYTRGLSNIEWLMLPMAPNGCTHGYQAYVTMFGGPKIAVEDVAEINNERNSLMDHLQKVGISTRPGTHAVHMLGLYKDKYKFHSEDFPNSYIADHCSLALPLFPTLSEEESNYVIDAIKNWGK